MTVTATDIDQLRKLVSKLEKLLANRAPTGRRKPAKQSVATKVAKTQDLRKRTRRSGKELSAFRRMLKAERKRGVPVADLAKKHKISTAYIYAL